MIPIVIGPTGVGYTSIETQYNNYYMKTTLDTEILINAITWATGPTGPTGSTGPVNPITGAAAIYSITGPTGNSIKALLYNPTGCQLRQSCIDGDIQLGPFICQQNPSGYTGSIGPTGASVVRVTPPFSNMTVQTIYSDNTMIQGKICCLCPSLTGYTGPTGWLASTGATGPIGNVGLNSVYGATGPTGRVYDSLPITDATYIRYPSGKLVIKSDDIIINTFTRIYGTVGPQGDFEYTTFASAQLDTPVNFTTTGSYSLQRNYMRYKSINDVIFPDSMLEYNITYNSYNSAFEALGNGIRCNQNLFFRMQMSWDCDGSPGLRPFAVINLASSLSKGVYPTIISTLMPQMSTSDDICCMANEGDVISIVAGSFALYPISNSKQFIFNIRNMNLNIIELFYFTAPPT